MEKISRILPSSHRFQAAEKSKSQPARPGASQYGRMSESEIVADKISLSKEAKEFFTRPGSADSAAGQIRIQSTDNGYKPSPSEQKNKIVDDIQRKFFSNMKKDVRDTDMSLTEMLAENRVAGSPSFRDFADPTPSPLSPLEIHGPQEQQDDKAP